MIQFKTTSSIALLSMLVAWTGIGECALRLHEGQSIEATVGDGLSYLMLTRHNRGYNIEIDAGEGVVVSVWEKATNDETCGDQLTTEILREELDVENWNHEWWAWQPTVLVIESENPAAAVAIQLEAIAEPRFESIQVVPVVANRPGLEGTFFRRSSKRTVPFSRFSPAGHSISPASLRNLVRYTG